MGVIPISIAIGIIEDKIANDLSSNDDNTKNKIIKHLEDVKNKICKTKETEFINKIVTIVPKGNGEKVTFNDCININFNDKTFVIFESEKGAKDILSRDIIAEILIIDKDDAAAVKNERG